MQKEWMTPRERWVAVLEGEKPDRIPRDFWGTAEVEESLKAHFGKRSVWEVFELLHIDKAYFLEPEYKGPALPGNEDMYGCRYEFVDYGKGKYWECVYNPLGECRSLAEVEAGFRCPSPDWFDYSGLEKKAREYSMYPIGGGGSEPFLDYKNLRGEARAFMDLVENPDIVEFVLGKLFDFRYEYTRRILESSGGLVTFSYVAEDLGGQSSLLFSLEHIRKFLFPGMKRMADLAHQAGAYVFCHSDGAIYKVIPELIDLGIDILNPIQWRCKGMERERLKEEFGDKLVFHGGVDNQVTLAFGTVEDVKREVEYNIEVLGRDGGYILAPCHNIQPLTPVENILAMYELP